MLPKSLKKSGLITVAMWLRVTGVPRGWEGCAVGGLWWQQREATLAILAHAFVSNESMDPSTSHETKKKCKVTAKK
jgi:hypothetical protein